MNRAAYYNEMDPHAAQWLRNLIAAGQIAAGDVDERSVVDVRPDDLRGFTQVQALLVSSAFGRVAGDRLDKEPKPFQAKPCSPQTGAAQVVHAPVCVQSLSRGILRTLHSNEAHSDSACRTAYFANPAATSLLSLRGIWPPFLGAFRGKTEQTWHCWPFCTCQNRAICCVALARSEKVRHMSGRYGLPRVEVEGSFSAIGPCIGLSSISYVSERLAFQCRTQCNEVAMKSSLSPLIKGKF